LVTIQTGISGQTLGYTGARALSADVMALANYISEITLLDSLSAKASNYRLPVLNAENAPVQIVLPPASMVTNPATYDRISVTASQPVTSLTTNPGVVTSSDSPVNTGASGTTSSSTTAVATGASADTAPGGTSQASAGGTSTGSVGQSAGFTSADLLDPPAIESGAKFEVEVPVTAFRHTDENAKIALRAELADGGSLPDWISFDPVSNKLSGTAPTGVSVLAVVVIATDERGGEIKAPINLQFAK
jgi:hypothetical protein